MYAVKVRVSKLYRRTGSTKALKIRALTSSGTDEFYTRHSGSAAPKASARRMKNLFQSLQSRCQDIQNHLRQLFLLPGHRVRVITIVEISNTHVFDLFFVDFESNRQKELME